jgi:Tfp pilus assembly protein PilF
MKSAVRFSRLGWIVVLLAFLALPTTRAEESATNAPAPAETAASPASPDRVQIQRAVRQMQAHKLDDALNTLNEAIELNPKNQVSYFLRASIFASRNHWPAAEKDLLVAESITPADVDIEMFLGDVYLMEKNYDAARTRFAALTKDSNRGDLATYKVFVCDVLGGHDDIAAKELDTFDHSPSKPSCYYAHATASLANKKTEEGRRWLDSAAVLYGPAVTAPYAQCLRGLGYLPLPPKPKP